MKSRYKVVLVRDSSHQWRLLELRPPKKGERGRSRFVCIAIGTGRVNASRLKKHLK